MNPGRPSSAPANRALGSARAAKQDEFYTQLADIENELRHYKPHLRGKTILCNCDDPFESNFFKYFALNFNALGIKKLIASTYQGSPVAGLQLPLEDYAGYQPNGKPALLVEINEVPDLNHDGAVDLLDVQQLLRCDANTSRRLRGDGAYLAGDFRSPDCIEVLKQADIVVTNPPFSLFREYVAQLVEHGKHFLIIGPKNAITYKDIFPLIQDNQLWLGHGFAAGHAYFQIPAENARAFAPGVYNERTGLVRFGNVGWFTNMDHQRRPESILLFRKYSPDQYPKYDNYDAINVDRVVDIPGDYPGVMGVPVTFLDRYNPAQFEILGLAAGNTRGLAGIPTKTGKDGPYLGGKLKYGRIFVRLKVTL